MPRSFLYVPANREKFLEKAHRAAGGRLHLRSRGFRAAGGEGRMPAPGVQRLRAERSADNRVWVRVNGLETGFAEADLDAVIGVAGLAGHFPAQSRDARGGAALGRHDRRAGSMRAASPQARLKLVLSIESALGVLNAYDMAIARRARRFAHLRRRAGRRSQHRSRLRLVDRRAGDDARARTHAAGRARGALRHARSTACSPTCAMPRASSRTPRCRAGSAIAGASSSIPSQIEPCNRLYAPSQRRARLLRPRAGGVRQGGGARQRLDHRRRQDDRRCDGECRAPRAGRRSGVEKGGIGFCRGSAKAGWASASPSTNYRLALPKGAVSCSNSSMTVPGPDSSAKSDRHALAIGGAHAGNAARLPVGLDPACAGWSRSPPRPLRGPGRARSCRHDSAHTAAAPEKIRSHTSRNARCRRPGHAATTTILVSDE